LIVIPREGKFLNKYINKSFSQRRRRLARREVVKGEGAGGGEGMDV
jgi:hypothetical protein